jgi:hypothetical protein
MSPCLAEIEMSTSLESLATKIIVTATPNITAARAAQLMRAHHVGSVIVVDPAADNGRPVGIVTDRDLVLDDAGRVIGLAALEDLLEALARELGELVQALRGARERPGFGLVAACRLVRAHPSVPHRRRWRFRQVARQIELALRLEAHAAEAAVGDLAARDEGDFERSPVAKA